MTARRTSPRAADAPSIHVIDSGPQTTVQDLGRPGLARIGVGAAGAFDRGALALANRLVGNAPAAAGLEILLGGLTFSASHDIWIALAGASGEADADGVRLEEHLPQLVPAGARVQIGVSDRGVRRYLAVRGGIGVEPVLGSRSRDTLAALGPAVLAAGDRLPLGDEPGAPVPSIDSVPVDPPAAGAVRIGLRPGPRHDWFVEATDALLVESVFSATPRSDRTGIRLHGPPLERRVQGELASEGMVPGGLQVSPDGAITVLGPDAPVTGGYPVVAVVVDADLDLLAQVRPGQEVRFHHAGGRR